MDDYRPIITPEEWEQFVQEFGLELEAAMKLMTLTISSKD